MIWQGTRQAKLTWHPVFCQGKGRQKCRCQLLTSWLRRKRKNSRCSNWISLSICHFSYQWAEERKREAVLLQLSYSSFLSEDVESFHAWSLTCRNAVIVLYLKRPLTYSSRNWVSFFPSNVIDSWSRRWKYTLPYQQAIEDHLCQGRNNCSVLPTLKTPLGCHEPGSGAVRWGSALQHLKISSEDLRRLRTKTSQGLKLISSSLCSLQVVYPKGKMRYNRTVLAPCPVLSLLAHSHCVYFIFFSSSHFLYLNEAVLDYIKTFLGLYLSHTNLSITVPQV